MDIRRLVCACNGLEALVLHCLQWLDQSNVNTREVVYSGMWCNFDRITANFIRLHYEKITQNDVVAVRGGDGRRRENVRARSSESAVAARCAADAGSEAQGCGVANGDKRQHEGGRSEENEDEGHCE